MTPTGQRLPFVVQNPLLGAAGLVPLLPIQLSLTQTVATSGLLDTGSAINVLPWSIGQQLGGNGNRQTVPVSLTGNLSAVPAKAILVDAVVGSFPHVKLAFARANSDSVPLLLGRVNFFAEFDVCFYRHRGEFEVKPKS